MYRAITGYRLSLPLLLTLLTVGASLSQSAWAQSAADTELVELLDEVWDFELTESPLLATDVGDPRGQDRLADDSLDAIRGRHQRRREFLQRLEQIDSDQLSANRRIDQELLRRRLDNQLAAFRFQMHLMPINNREGFHIQFPELPRMMSPRTESDFSNYISRLKDFPRYTDQQIDLLRGGIEAGLTQPAIIMRDSLSQIEAQIVENAQRSPLLSNLPSGAGDRFSDQAWQRIREDISAAILSDVVPAYEKFARFMDEEYLPACRGSVSASALPDGRAFYRDAVERFTTLNLSPQQIHQTGIEENARIREEMESIRREVGFEGDLSEFLEHLRTDPKFYAKTPEELMQTVALILKRADGKLPELFGRLPRIPYGIREVPDYVAPQTTSAYYWPPATDGSRAGFYYVNTYNLSSRPLYQIEALSMHEAVPGHHLQLALQAELSDLHPISRQSNITAFIEGWALYSERLGKEIGFYRDPYQDFGRLSMEAWRASRLVVDTGIHSMGWSRQRAIDYMRDNTALSEHNVVAEVDRYIGWPGQALAYKIGELTISKLRREAEEKLGDDFDVRGFHDRVLEAGAIPMPLLKKRVQQWIEVKREQ